MRFFKEDSAYSYEANDYAINFRARLKALGITARQFAEYAGISRATAYHYAEGRRVPDDGCNNLVETTFSVLFSEPHILCSVEKVCIGKPKKSSHAHKSKSAKKYIPGSVRKAMVTDNLHRLFLTSQRENTGVMILPAGYREEIDIALHVGRSLSELYLIDKSPATMAWCTMRLTKKERQEVKGHKFTGMVRDVMSDKKKLTSMPELSAAHLDFCSTAKESKEDIVQFAASGKMRNGFVAITMCRRDWCLKGDNARISAVKAWLSFGAKAHGTKIEYHSSQKYRNEKTHSNMLSVVYEFKTEAA